MILNIIIDFSLFVFSKILIEINLEFLTKIFFISVIFTFMYYSRSSLKSERLVPLYNHHLGPCTAVQS